MQRIPAQDVLRSTVTVEYNLQQGQQMIIDTGYLAMMDETCSMDIVRFGHQEQIPRW